MAYVSEASGSPDYNPDLINYAANRQTTPPGTPLMQPNTTPPPQYPAGGSAADPTNIYGPGGIASSPPYPGATWDPQKQNWNPQSAAGPSSTMPAGIDPTLASIYTQGGLAPAGEGSGFADWQYWQQKGPSQYDRLKADIAGTGTDQWTGTPGAGVWQNSGRNQPAATPGTGVAAPITADRPYVSTVVGGSMTTPNLPKSQEASDLYNYLMGRAKEGTGVDASDPNIKASTDAFRANEDRQVRNDLSSLAEGGGAYANLSGAARSEAEKGAQATSTFEAQAIQHERDARRQEIQQALQLGTNLLTTEQQQALQLELQQLNAQSNEFQQLRDLQERGFEFGVNRQDNVALA